MSASTIAKPAFDPQLEVVLQAMPKESPEALSHEGIIERRKLTAPQSDPAVIFTDPELLHEDIKVPGPAGVIQLTVIRSKSSAGRLRPCIYHNHGGGMIIGGRLFLISGYFHTIKELDVVMVTVEYRLAPEHEAPAQVEDSYAGLKWVSENAAKLGIDVNKIMVSGSSAGGGLAAGVALLARDRKGPPLLAQLLNFPMLDDRNDSISVKQYMTEGTWTGTKNIGAWKMLLPGKSGAVSQYAAPARAEDLSGLPQAYMDVGDAEPFRDEDVAYATKLWAGGVSCELHVWPGAWHGFNILAPEASISRLAISSRFEWIRRIFAAPSASNFAPVP